MISDKSLEGLGIRPTSMPIYDIPMDLIEIVDWNPNEMDDDTFNRLAEEISDVGFIEPIQVAFGDNGKFKTVGGEHRFLAARTLSFDTLPCVILDMPDDLQKLVNVRLNVIRGKLNPAKFTKLYEDVSKKYSADRLQSLFGFTNKDAFSRLISGAVDSAIDSTIATEDAKKKLRKKAKGAKSVDSLGRILKDFFEKGSGDLSSGFMIFVHGGNAHMYVEMNNELKAQVDNAAAFCRSNGSNMNDFLSSAIAAMLK